MKVNFGLGMTSYARCNGCLNYDVDVIWGPLRLNGHCISKGVRTKRCLTIQACEGFEQSCVNAMRHMSIPEVAFCLYRPIMHVHDHFLPRLDVRPLRIQ